MQKVTNKNLIFFSAAILIFLISSFAFPKPVSACDENYQIDCPEYIECECDSDCGTSAFYGEPFCEQGDVFRSYRTTRCINPGTPDSYCSNESSSELWYACEPWQVCSSGSCVNTTNPPVCPGPNCPSPPPAGSGLSVSCSVTPNPAIIDQQVSFTSTATGGTGLYAYSWTGACLGSSPVCSTAFYTPGNKQAVLTVTSGPESATALCEASVSQNCAYHAYQQCVGNNLQWFDSCGNAQDYFFCPNGCAGSRCVQITYTQQIQPIVFGAATNVSTGLTNNFWLDSFLLPLILALAGVWMWRAGLFFGIEKWLDSRKKVKHAHDSKKELSRRLKGFKDL